MHREHHRDNLLIYCTDGKAFLNVAGEPYTVTAGDLLLLPAGASHRYTADPDNPWTIHWVHYTGPLAAEFGGYMGLMTTPASCTWGASPVGWWTSTACCRYARPASAPAG